MRRSKVSITRVLLIIFGLTTGVLSLSLYVAADALIHRFVCDQAAKEARIVSELVFAGLYGSMRAGWNADEIAAVVERARESVPGAHIELVRGEPVAALFGESPCSRERRESSPEVEQVLSTGQEHILEEADSIQLFYPFVATQECLSCHTNIAPGQVNGVVHMTLPLTPLKEPLSRAFTGVIQAVAAMTLLFLLIQFLVNRRFIVRPLMRLTSHILHVQRTGALMRRDPLGDDPSMFLELHLLAQSFDAMMDKLAGAQEQLRQQSEQDDLTGLLNRRAFNRSITLELGRAKRYARQVAVFVVDLDDFKAINDTHGHAAGDAVLRHCAELLSQNLRENDIIARIGGDELVIVVPEMDQSSATAFRSKLKDLIEQTPTEYEDISLQVGASIGMALFPWDGDNPQRLLRHADASMYEEKRLKKMGHKA